MMWDLRDENYSFSRPLGLRTWGLIHAEEDQSIFCIYRFSIQSQLTKDQTYQKKIPESSKIHDLNLSYTGNYLHSI